MTGVVPRLENDGQHGITLRRFRFYCRPIGAIIAKHHLYVETWYYTSKGCTAGERRT